MLFGDGRILDSLVPKQPKRNGVLKLCMIYGYRPWTIWAHDSFIHSLWLKIPFIAVAVGADGRTYSMSQGAAPRTMATTTHWRYFYLQWVVVVVVVDSIAPVVAS